MFIDLAPRQTISSPQCSWSSGLAAEAEEEASERATGSAKSESTPTDKEASRIEGEREEARFRGRVAPSNFLFASATAAVRFEEEEGGKFLRLEHAAVPSIIAGSEK